MLPFADVFPHWKDFPKGLHVLVVDEDEEVLSDIKSKLEACDYAVTSFTSGEDALEALQDPASTFHVILAEATARDGLDGFKILEATKNVPAIMMSSTENIAMTMRGIALGASDFLQKPLSDEKLRNIWQHVVRKAASSGQFKLPEHQPTKESKLLEQAREFVKTESLFVEKNDPVVTMKAGILEDDVKLADSFIAVGNNSRHLDADPDVNHDFPVSCERLSAPPTPQLEHMERISSAEYALEDSSSSKYEVDDIQDGHLIDNKCFQAKKEAAEDAVVETTNSCDLDTWDETSNSCDLLDVNSHSGGLGNCDLEKLDSEFCAHIQFDDKLDDDDSIDDIGLSGDFSIDADVLSKLDMDFEILDELAFEQSLNVGVGCFYGTNFQEFKEEEATLLAEVAKAEKDGLVRKSVQCCGQPMRSNNKGRCTVDKKVKKTELREGDKGCKSAEGKKKIKVDWTPELHRRFVQAVEQLGVDKAIPSRILELMGVQCLTRHNIASHLQKYRSHRKHLLEREAEAANWNDRRHLDPVPWIRHRKDGTSWVSPSHSYPPPIQPRRSHGFTPIQPHPTTHGPPLAPLLHVWGHPTVDHSAMHIWQMHPVSSATWQTAEATFWQPGPMACLDAWGHPAPAPGMPWYPQPMVRLPLAPMPGAANMAVTASSPGGMIYENVDGVSCVSKLFGCHPPKETIDAAINEVLKNPCTPLPLGLKPPSLESVLTELQRQGINKVPPTSS